MGLYPKALSDYCKGTYLILVGGISHHPLDLHSKKQNFSRTIFEPNSKFLAIELDGLDSDHFLNRAYIYEMYEMFEEALNDYAKSIELNPKNEVAFNNRSNLWNTLGLFFWFWREKNEFLGGKFFWVF